MSELRTEILDEKDNFTESSLRESLKWHEKRRVWYNVAVGTSGVIGLLFMPWLFLETAIIAQIVIYGIFVNGMCCAGFLLKALGSYYFNGALNFENFRGVLFWLGLIASVCITFFGALMIPWLLI